MSLKPEYHPAGDSALFIKLGDEISKEVNSDIRYICSKLTDKKLKGIIEWVPSYTGITIYYNPIVLDHDKLETYLSKIYKNKATSIQTTKKIIHIPVCYQGEYAPDIKEVALHNNKTIEEVIKIHTSKDYLIYMLGFSPGFPYLGGMNTSIATPRREEPRTFIPAGSVGIAGEQTGIYSVNSPGGWQIIGKTPLSLFNKDNIKPFLLEAGMYVRFFPIDQKEFSKIDQEVAEDKYNPKISTTIK